MGGTSHNPSNLPALSHKKKGRGGGSCFGSKVQQCHPRPPGTGARGEAQRRLAGLRSPLLPSGLSTSSVRPSPSPASPVSPTGQGAEGVGLTRALRGPRPDPDRRTLPVTPPAAKASRPGRATRRGASGASGASGVALTRARVHSGPAPAPPGPPRRPEAPHPLPRAGRTRGLRAGVALGVPTRGGDQAGTGRPPCRRREEVERPWALCVRRTFPGGSSYSGKDSVSSSAPRRGESERSDLLGPRVTQHL